MGGYRDQDQPSGRIRMRKVSRDTIKKRKEKYAASERQTLQLLELHPALERWGEEMRSKYDITLHKEGLEGYDSWKSQADEEWNRKTWSAWQCEIYRFRQRLRLTRNYYEALCYYVVTGSFQDADTSKIRVTVDIVNKEWVNLRISAPASKEEIVDAVLEASEYLNTRVVSNKDGTVTIQGDTKQWKGWKYRPQLDRDIKALTLAERKKSNPDLTNLDIVAELYPTDDEDEEIATTTVDKKRARQLHVILARIRKAMKERFLTNTF